MGEDEYTPSIRPSLFEDAEEDPYESRELSELPDWWHENVETFNEYGLRPYRPPVFDDGALVPAVKRGLEEDLGVTIRIRAVNPHEVDRWEVWVDDDPAFEVDRHRDSDGYTVYETTSQSFVNRIREAVGGE